VARFAVEFEVANYGDLVEVERGHRKAADVRRAKITGMVDPGASRLILPASFVDQLGLVRRGKTRVKYADGRTAWREEAPGVWVSLEGRESVYSAIVEPKRTPALIGALVLEDLDFLVDCKAQKLIPRDPRGIVSEVE
jgi:predicted aspartyl protease